MGMSRIGETFGRYSFAGNPGQTHLYVADRYFEEHPDGVRCPFFGDDGQMFKVFWRLFCRWSKHHLRLPFQLSSLGDVEGKLSRVRSQGHGLIWVLLAMET